MRQCFQISDVCSEFTLLIYFINFVRVGRTNKTLKKHSLFKSFGLALQMKHFFSLYLNDWMLLSCIIFKKEKLNWLTEIFLDLISVLRIFIWLTQLEKLWKGFTHLRPQLNELKQIRKSFKSCHQIAYLIIYLMNYQSRIKLYCVKWQ